MTARLEGLARLRALPTQSWATLDTETTGLGPWDEVVEVAVVSSGGEGLFESRVRPSRPIPAKATAVHGLNASSLEDAPSWPEVWPAVESTLQGLTILAWNAAFDLRLIRQTCARYGLPLQAPPFLCLQQIFRDRSPFVAASLSAACLALGVPGRPTHRAAVDAEVTRQVAWALIEEAAWED